MSAQDYLDSFEEGIVIFLKGFEPWLVLLRELSCCDVFTAFRKEHFGTLDFDLLELLSSRSSSVLYFLSFFFNSHLFWEQLP